MDLEYADGTRDGVGYIENMCALYGTISGASDMVRERFTVSGGDRQVGEVWVRVKRTFGTGPLELRLERADGSVLDVVEIPADVVPIAEPGCTEGGAAWVGASLAMPQVLEDGSRYRLVLATDEETQYTADPIREGTDFGFRSYRFTDGDAQRTTDGGATWVAMYEWSPVDLQFYFAP
jgi:hypothetical protein